MDVELALRPRSLSDESGAALDLGLGEVDLGLSLGDRGLGDRLHLLLRQDVELGFGELGVERRGVHAHEHLAGFHEIAFVHEDLLDSERFLSGDLDELGFYPAVA